MAMTLSDEITGSLHEGGEIGATWEEVLYYDPNDLEGAKVALEYSSEANELCVSKGWPFPMGRPFGGALPGVAKETKSQISPDEKSVYRWQERVKRALDPNGTSDSDYSHLLEEEDIN